jgi:hypothetical protein
MTSIRTALASALTVAALCTLGVYASHEATSTVSRSAVNGQLANPITCCAATTKRIR